MKFALDYRIRLDEETVALNQLVETLDSHRERLAQADPLEGALVVCIDGSRYCEEFVEPILRLGDQWVRKIPWVLSGDTETVAYRNSEHCFAFMPAGDSVELSFFSGSESEVEEYVIEPVTVRLDVFVSESVRLMERLLEVVNMIDPSLCERNEDCRDLKASLEEAKQAWRDYLLHNRR